MYLECYHCFERYDNQTSDASCRSMYCSAGCEKAEVERLEEGNRIIEAAKEENPAAFHKSESEALPKTAEGLLKLIQFNTKPIKQESTED